jgi:hypothetical protein
MLVPEESAASDGAKGMKNSSVTDTTRVDLMFMMTLLVAPTSPNCFFVLRKDREDREQHVANRTYRRVLTLVKWEA